MPIRSGAVLGLRLPAGTRGCQTRGVSLSQIRYFVTVAEEANVGRAAQRLHVAQPAISRQIRALEDELGTPLFSRTSRGMALLPSGRVFLDHARAILAAVDHAAEAVRHHGRLTDSGRDARRPDGSTTRG